MTVLTRPGSLCLCVVTQPLLQAPAISQVLMVSRHLYPVITPQIHLDSFLAMLEVFAFLARLLSVLCATEFCPESSPGFLSSPLFPSPLLFSPHPLILSLFPALSLSS